MDDDAKQGRDSERALRQFWREYADTQELWARQRDAFPRDQNAGLKALHFELKRRHAEGDPNVIRYAADEIDNTPERFVLELTSAELDEIAEAYTAARDWASSDVDPDLDARIFARQVQNLGQSIPEMLAIQPPAQKERKRAIESTANAFDKFADALNKLDGAALGWLFAEIEDAAAKQGETLRPGGPDVTSLKRHWLRSQVEAAEQRQLLTLLARAVGPAIRSAAKTLPLADRDNPILMAAFGLERRCWECHVPFEATNTSFAAFCMQKILSLAGIEKGEPWYWLQKVDETPDEDRPWMAMLKAWKNK